MTGPVIATAPYITTDVHRASLFDDPLYKASHAHILVYSSLAGS